MQNVYKYTSEHKKWVLENSKKYENAEEMRKDFNETFNLQTSKSGFITLRYRLGVKNPDKYTKEQDKFIEENQSVVEGYINKESGEIEKKSMETDKTQHDER
jgi:hypothetical protein